MTTIGIIGFGGIGRQLLAYADADPGLDVSFVLNRSPIDTDLAIDELDDASLARTDVVVEVAHPDVTRAHGRRILESCDYMPLSTTALVDDELLGGLVATANEHGTRLLLPHGAIVGLEALVASSVPWSSVEITFVKPPQSIEQGDVSERTVLYEGPVRDIAAKYPRNVNAMVTLALATTGLDACIGRLIADPAATLGSLEIDARSEDGARVHIAREQPMTGVSGTEMFDSLVSSLRLATGASSGPLAFC